MLDNFVPQKPIWYYLGLLTPTNIFSILYHYTIDYYNIDYYNII